MQIQEIVNGSLVQFSSFVNLTITSRSVTYPVQFGGRATGEPHGGMTVMYDIDGHIDDVTFQTASPIGMSVARPSGRRQPPLTPTALKARSTSSAMRGAGTTCGHYEEPDFGAAVKDRDVARAVAKHMSYFFSEKDSRRQCDFAALTGALQVAPEPMQLQVLERAAVWKAPPRHPAVRRGASGLARVDHF